MASFLANFFSTKTQHAVRQKCHYTLEHYDQTYTVVKLAMKLSGLRLTLTDSNVAKFWWNVFYWFSFLNQAIVAAPLQAVNMMQGIGGGTFDTAIEIFRTMPCIGYLLLAIGKSYKITYYRPVYENLVAELRSMWPVGRVTEEEDRIIQTALKQIHSVIKGYYWCNNGLLVMFLSPSLVVILQKVLGYDVELILPLYYWFPFDPFQRGFYEVVLILESWHCLSAIWLILSGDLLFCIFLSHITTQLELLAVRIRKLFYVPIDQQLLDSYPLGEYSTEYVKNDKQAIETFGESEWEQRHHMQLTEIVKRHLALIRLAGDVENMYGFPLLMNFFNSSMIICFCGFCAAVVEKWNEMVYKSFLLTSLLQTWLLCWYGQKVLDSSQMVSDALYSSGWYKASKKMKSSVMIMLHRTQEEIRVTTYGFSVISLTSYTSIIKTAWSYFTLLLNIYEE